jgi:hypothetical protein
MGVPQGSILSVTLFSIKINSFAKILNDNIEGSLYVDDFLICYRGKNMNNIEDRKFEMKLGSLPFNPISKRSFKIPYFHVASYAFSKSKKIDTACSFLDQCSPCMVS